MSNSFILDRYDCNFFNIYYILSLDVHKKHGFDDIIIKDPKLFSGKDVKFELVNGDAVLHYGDSNLSIHGNGNFTISNIGNECISTESIRLFSDHLLELKEESLPGLFAQTLHNFNFVRSLSTCTYEIKEDPRAICKVILPNGEDSKLDFNEYCSI